MWKIINSPIIIAVIIIGSLIAYDRSRNSTAAMEMRGIYKELLSISEEATSDLEKKKVITNFVKEAGKQFRDGFSSFNSEEKKKKQASQNKHHFQVKKQIKITSPKVVETKRYSKLQKAIVYQVINNSQEYLSKVGHTIEFYYEGELLDVKDEWGNIKLAPGDRKSYSYKIDNEKLIFNNVKIVLGDIAIMPVAE